jgi:hypothetical protein
MAICRVATIVSSVIAMNIEVLSQDMEADLIAISRRDDRVNKNADNFPELTHK